MRRFGYSFLVLILAVVLSVPNFSLGIEPVFADNNEDELLIGHPVTDVNNKEVQGELTFRDLAILTEDGWKVRWGGNVVLEVWYDIMLGDDGTDEGEEPKKATVKLRKKNKDGDFVDTGQEHEIKSLGKDKKQTIKFTGLKQGETYQIVVDASLIWNPFAMKRHRIKYKLFHDNPIHPDYELKTSYDYKRGGNDVVKYSIGKKGKDGNVHFNGKVRYKIYKAFGEDKEAVSKTKDVISSSSKSFQIDEFKDSEHLPPEIEKSDSSKPRTRIEVVYEGVLDGVNKNNRYWRLKRETRIYREKDKLDLQIKKENGEVKVTAKANLDKEVKDKIKDGKWEIALLKENVNKSCKDAGETICLKAEKPKDNKDKKVTATFKHEDFKDNKSAYVRAVYTAKKLESKDGSDEVVLYRQTAKKKVDRPSGSGGSNNDNPSDGGQQQPRDDGQQKPKDDKDKPKDDKDKPKEDKDKPKEDNDNDKDNNPRNDDGQNQQDNQRNQQDEDQRNQQDNEQAKNEDAAIEIKSKVLKEQQQVQIEASLTGVEEPEGDWKLVFNSDDQDNKQEEEEKQTKNQTTFTKTFSISSIKKDTVKVVASFKGKDKKGKIDVTKEEEVNLKDESQKDGDTNEDGTTADEDKVIEKVVQNTQTPPSGQVGGKLPKTATNYGSSLLIGMLLLMSGGIFLLLRRRRTS